MTDTAEITQLHVYAQTHWHAEAFICGDRGALEKLHAALGEALKSGRAEMSSFTNDGEGYMLHIIEAPALYMGQMSLPYTDEIAADSRNQGPWDLLQAPPGA